MDRRVEATRNVFKVPDYNSDIEDSDSESELEEITDTTIHTGVFFNNQSSGHIDLTKDDEKRVGVLHEIVQLDGPANHRVIDLTSPPRKESVEFSLSGYDVNREVSEDIASLVASEDQSHSESDAEFDADLSICLTDEENSADFSEEDSDSEVEDRSDEGSEESADMEGSEEDDFSSDDEPIVDSKSPYRPFCLLPVYSPALIFLTGAHGLMTWPEIDDKVASQHLANTLQSEPTHRAYHDVLDASLPSLNLPILATQLLPSILSNAPPMPTTTPLPSINAPALREPSPSDAAMMKSSVQPQTITHPTVELLKEKTGKHAYFEAREENKAALARQIQKYPSPPSAPQAMPANNDLSPRKSVWRAQAMLNAQEPIEPTQAGPSSQPVVKSPWLSTGDDFLNSPQEGRNHSRDQAQPENEVEAEDEAMTSAYQYHLWKQSRMEASQTSESNSRRIGINDIVMDQELCEQPVKNAETQENTKKRRAAAISTATQEEQSWHNEQQNEAPTADAVVQPISPPASPIGTATQISSETPRPTKRMRRIAERVGYAALGGATVGAMIVTSLIYTAPSFA